MNRESEGPATVEADRRARAEGSQSPHDNANPKTRNAPSKFGECETISQFWKSPRGRHQFVRVSFSSYENLPLIDLRIFAVGPDGKAAPTTRGICLTVKRLPELARAINRAIDLATARGTLSSEAEL